MGLDRRPKRSLRRQEIYALRDATSTVENIGLSALHHEQEIAKASTALVLDVKVGSGAFMKRRKRSGETSLK